MNTFACIDIGGTAIKYGILNENGSVVQKNETETQAYKGGEALAEKVEDLVRQMIEQDENIAGIAISTAGVVDSENGCIIHASDAIPNYIGINYKERLEKKFARPTEVENDVNCAGLAEAQNGKGKDAASMLMLTIGTGIGGCFIEEGNLLHGNCFSACEVGYMPINGIPFQDIGATSALVNNVAKKKNEPLSLWNGKKIFACADQGDQDCIQAIKNMCDVLGQGMALISFVLNPEVIVLGGGIMAQGEKMRQDLEDAFAAHTIPLIAKNTRIEFAQHANDAGMKGALANFLKKHPQSNE